MEKIKVLVVEDNKFFLKMMKKYFEKNSQISIAFEAGDGAKGYEIIKESFDEIDLIILDLVMPNKDGVFILEKMQEDCIFKNIIVISSLNQEDIIRRVCDFGIKYFMLKPFEFKDLEKRIIDFQNMKYEGYIIDVENKKLNNKISKILHSLGVPTHINGYNYLRKSIELTYNNQELLKNITKILYCEIAKEFKTTGIRVERSIRHAIELGWNRGDLDLIDEIFGSSVDVIKAKPTNLEYITAIVDKLIFENKK